MKFERWKYDNGRIAAVTGVPIADPVFNYNDVCEVAEEYDKRVSNSFDSAVKALNEAVPAVIVFGPTTLGDGVKELAKQLDNAVAELAAAHRTAHGLKESLGQAAKEIAELKAERDAQQPGTVRMGEPVAFGTLEPGTHFKYPGCDCTHVKLKNPKGLWTALVVSTGNLYSGDNAQIYDHVEVRPILITAPATEAAEPGDWTVVQHTDGWWWILNGAWKKVGESKVIKELVKTCDAHNNELRALREQLSAARVDVAQLKQVNERQSHRVAELEKTLKDTVMKDAELWDDADIELKDLRAALTAANTRIAELSQGQPVEQWEVKPSPDNSIYAEIHTIGGVKVAGALTWHQARESCKAHNTSRAALTPLEVALIELGGLAVQEGREVDKWTPQAQAALAAVVALQQPPEPPMPRYEARAHDPLEDDSGWDVWDSTSDDWGTCGAFDEATARALADVLNKESQ